MKEYLVVYYKKGGYHSERVQAMHMPKAIEIIIDNFGLSHSQIFSCTLIPNSF